jgi:hypothetical protein
MFQCVLARKRVISFDLIVETLNVIDSFIYNTIYLQYNFLLFDIIVYITFLRYILILP